MKTGLKVFLALLLRLRGLEEGSGRGTDGEGIQRGAGRGVQTRTLAPPPPDSAAGLPGEAETAQELLAGCGCCPVWEDWPRLQSPRNRSLRPALSAAPRASCPLFGGALLPVFPLTPGLSVSVLSP